MKNIPKTAKNFIDGIASITSVATYKKQVKLFEFTSPQSDIDNLTADWYNIGNDINKSMQRFECEQTSTI